MKNLRRKIRKGAQRIFASFLLITTVMWSFGPALTSLVPVAKAAGGINVMYVNDAGATPDTFLDDTVSKKAFLEITVFDEAGGTLNSVSVCLDEMNGFSPTTDLTALTLWQDDGDGVSTPTEGGDTLLSTVSSYTTVADTYAMGGTCPQATFSSLGLSIPTSATSQMRLFVAAQAKANLDETPMHSFNPMIPVGGIDVTVSGTVIADWPSGMNAMFPPVFLGTEGSGGMFSPLLISEIQTSGTDGDDEFIELYNRDPGMTVDLSTVNFTIAYAVAATAEGTDMTVIGNWNTILVLNTGTVPGNGFYLIGSTNGAGYDGTPDEDISFNTFNLPEAGGIIGLFSPGGDLVDLVAYGNATASLAEGAQTALAPSANGSIERKAFPDSTLSKMAADGIHESKGNGEDSNNNAMDFIVTTTSVPQNISSTAESFGGGYDPGAGSPVILNEVFYNTDTATGWIELYNRHSESQDIAGWKIISNTKTYTIPASTSIATGAFAVVYWNVIGTDTVTNLYTSNSNGTTVNGDMATFGGDVILKDGSSAVKDYVQYGGSGFANESTATTANEWMTGDFVPNVLYGQSIGRRSTTGDDFNQSGDWQFYSSTSPGFSNMGGDSTAPTAVASVTLTDGDNMDSSGLDGNDVTVTWTPATAPDPSFDKYEIYLLPAVTAFDGDAHFPIDYIYGGQYYNGDSSLTFTYTGGGFLTKDSTDTTLSTGDYKAYVIAVDFAGNRSGTAISASATLTAEAYDAGNDTQKPFIMHMPVRQAKATADIVLIARFQDDRELGAVPGVGAQVIWKAGTNASPPDLSVTPTTTNCVAIEAGFYSCTIPWGAWDANSVIGYYLKAKDAATTPNVNFVYGTWEENIIEATAIADPIMIDILAADGDAYGDYTDADADADLTGFVYASDGSPINGAKVFIEGAASGYVATGATGAFSIPDNTMYPGSFGAMAFEDGYMDMFLNVFKNESISFYLNSGDMNMMSGTDMPFVTWTAPGPGMMGAPTDIYCTGDCGDSTIAGEMPVLIGFSKPMNANTINDLDASNAGSNIYLTSNGNDRVGGKVYYDSIMNEARFYTSTHDVLQSNTFYNIVVTQGITDEDGNPIGGNMPDGSYSSGFVTMGDNTDFWDGGDYTDYGTSGMMMPPYVAGTTPNPGAYNVSPNSSMMVEFSEPMDSSSINNNSIKLYPVTNESTWTLGSAVSATVTLDQTTQKVATLNPSSDLPANSSNNGWYVLEIMGSAKSTAGIWFGDPSICGVTDPDTCLLTASNYANSFQVSAVTDIIEPTIVASYPNNNDGITVGTNAVDVGISSIEIGFSEAMNSSTITAQNITLASGSSSVTGSVKYDPMGNTAKFIPSSSLNSNTQYTLTISTSVTDLAGVAIASANTIIFKTGTADVVAPTLLYANGDDYTLAVTYSEPMNSAGQTNTSRWGTSVLNPANYFIKTVDSSSVGASPYSTVTALSSVSGLGFTYDEMNNTVIIEGFNFFVALPNPADYQIFVDLVTDRSNNEVANSAGRSISGGNATQGPIQNSADTYGILGPGTYDPMMDMGSMGMMMAGAFPMNGMAGQTSSYFIDVPTTKSIPSGGTIVMTFPSGFDVSNATKDTYSPVNNDINEWNAGTITIASVAGNQIARTVTITTGGGATQASDFLHMDIKGIVNSSIPKDFGTEGYLVDIKIFSTTGALLESITTMPFFLSEGGTYTLSGTITMRNGADSANVNIDNAETTTIYLGSPMTGPMEATVTFDGDHNADYSFTGLPEGEYHLFTEPTITVDVSSTATDFNGYMMPEPIWVNEATDASSDSSDNDVIDKDLTITQLDSGSGTAVTISLTGDFSTGGTADDIDIFASSPSGFRVKTISSAGNNPANVTLYLPNGNWMIGVGPAMPMGPMAGPPPMPDWMPPMPIDVKVENPTVTENFGTANDGTIGFDISSQVSTTVSGSVTDGTNGIADVEVYAYQPMGGFGGSFTKTATDGSFTLKMPVLGTYKIGAQKPGLPSSPEKTVDVQSNVTGISLVLQMPSYTISGKVLNSSSQAVAYAPVWAYQPDGWGHANTMTDSAGNYILYVDDGTWTIEADAPGVGWMQYDLAVTINGASQSDINIKPDTDTIWKTISGTISINDVAQTYMPIRAVAYDINGNYLGREYGGMTDSSGVYSISVPGIASGSKYYRVDIWTPDFGEVAANNLDNDATPNEAYPVDDKVDNSPANVIVGNSNVDNVDILITSGDLKTVTISFDNKADYLDKEAFINIDGVTYSGVIPTPTGFHKSIRVSDISGADPTVELKAGDYHFFVDVLGYGNYIPDSGSDAFDGTKKAVTIDGTSDNITFALPDLDGASMITIDGVVSGPDAGQKDAWVWVGNPETGFHSGQQANATTGAYSLVVPILASGSYMVGADKQGFISGEPTSNAGTEDATINFSLTAQTNTISGKIFTDISGGTDDTYDSGEEIVNGWVRAENTATGAQVNASVDGNGNYSLGVTDGEWKVYSSANGYTEGQYSEDDLLPMITVAGSDVSSKNVELSVNANWANKTKSSPITPASGGVVDDTAQDIATKKASGTGVKITLPPNALGSSTSSGNVSANETAAVSATSSMKPIGGTGKSITATDNSGQPITNLDNYINMEIVTYKADIDVAANMTDNSKLKTAKIGYWDDTLNEWINLPTTKKAYYKDTADTDWTLYNGTDTQSGFEEFIDDALGNTPTFVEGTDYDDYKIVATASTNHLTVFALGTSPDGLAPAAPAGLAQSSGTGTSNTIAWDAVTTNSDASAITDLYGYAIYRSTDDTTYSQVNSTAVLAGTETYTDTTTAAFTSYFYKITAGDDDDIESAFSTTVQMCSNSTVSNGTVATDCTITCDSGYNLSGNSCNAVGGGGAVGGDTTPPTSTSISISDGETTVTRIITITLSAIGASTMAVSENEDFAGASWENYATSKEFTLSEGNGEKTVYVKFKDSAGNIASVISDTITLSNQSEVTDTDSGDTADETTPSSKPDGTLLRYSDSPKVYVVRNGNQVWVQTAEEFEAAGYKWEDIQVIDVELKKEAGSVTLLRAIGGHKVYVIHNNKRKHITSAKAFNNAGYKWSEIQDVDSSQIDAYEDEVTSAVTLLRARGDHKVYVIQNNKRKHITSAEAFNNAGYKWEDIQDVDSSQIDIYEDESSSSVTLLRAIGGHKVYIIRNNKRKHIASAEAFNNAGYKWEDIQDVDSSQVDAYEEESGSVLPASTVASIKITFDWLRVRKDNTTESSILGMVYEGESYEVLDKKNGWYKIKSKIGIGWVSGVYVQEL